MTATLLERRKTQETLEGHGFHLSIDDPLLAKAATISHQFSPKKLELATLADLGRMVDLPPVTIRDPKLARDAKIAAAVEAEMAQFWTVPLNAGTPSGTTTGTPLTASTSLTDISPGATTQAFALAAGQIQYVGQTFRIKASGTLSATSTPTLLMGVYYGGVAGTALAATAATATGAQSTAPWFLEYTGRITALGSSGAILGQGWVIGTAATPTTMTFMPASPASVAINTTTQNAVTVGAQWGTNNASTIVVNQFVIEQLF
jgi:hypothetical protein